LSVEDFRAVVAEWVMSGLPTVRKREFELPLEPTSIISVLGPRRAGKTYLLYHTISRLLVKGVPKQNILYVDFEHPRLTEVKVEDLDNMLEAFYEISRPDPNFPSTSFWMKYKKCATMVDGSEKG